MTEEKYKEALQALVDAILECGAATDIDAGCGGYGPMATALQVLGKTDDEANKLIWGDAWESEE